MLQGFALGGEVGPSTAFLLEAAPLNRRGFYTAFQGWSQNLAVLASGLVGFTLANTLSERQLQDFGCASLSGWRGHRAFWIDDAAQACRKRFTRQSWQARTRAAASALRVAILA